MNDGRLGLAISNQIIIQWIPLKNRRPLSYPLLLELFYVPPNLYPLSLVP